MSGNVDEMRSTVVKAFLGNPFSVDGELRARAFEILEAGDYTRLLDSLVAERKVVAAKRLLLSIGHWQAQQTPDAPSVVLGDDVIPRRLAQLLPRDRSSYLRIVMAAGRCYRALCAIYGDSDAIERVRRETWAACFGDSLHHAMELERVIRDHDVLILGETGTGKELFARAMLDATPGPMTGEPAPSASLNAAAIPESLVESELFGHIKGAFTGASEVRKGRIRTASGGGLFLDEVGDLPSTVQVKLLRVIETNEVFPLGSDRGFPVDVRYVAATHKRLEEMVEARTFRQDLFERLAGNVIRIPPLRDRPDDIQAIGEAFIQKYVSGVTGATHSDQIREWLSSRKARAYGWPGNVRELQNALRNLLLGLSPGLRGNYWSARGTEAPPVAAPELPRTIAEGTATMREVQDWYLQKVLIDTDYNYAAAARLLGVDRSTVRRRSEALG